MADDFSNVKVLFFDTFGTTVAQRKPVADELWSAATDALKADDGRISNAVRQRVKQMTHDDWFDLGGEWNKEEGIHVAALIARDGNVDWRAVDKHRSELLVDLLARRGLVLRSSAPGASSYEVQPGSLFDGAQLRHLGSVWHRLTPWPDTVRGLELLNKKYTTVALSNTYNELLRSLVAHSSIPFQHVLSSDMFNSYKPNPKVYLGAAEWMGVKPEECALVAAHLSDLKGAKACGFRVMYVERPLEEKTPELRAQGIPELFVREDEEGFVALARRLGIE